mmetsp:Transcript_8990/g.29791  ORF Transcript_8990/g.29791 Transcript_8990/m.29791 type:complete len:257 (-) Transcript_8990:91-861(-)|eukprot:scaffold869_cov105-Isochrysis_galbana.AAC.41
MHADTHAAAQAERHNARQRQLGRHPECGLPPLCKPAVTLLTQTACVQGRHLLADRVAGPEDAGVQREPDAVGGGHLVQRHARRAAPSHVGRRLHLRHDVGPDQIGKHVERLPHAVFRLSRHGQGLLAVAVCLVGCVRGPGRCRVRVQEHAARAPLAFALQEELADRILLWLARWLGQTRRTQTDRAAIPALGIVVVLLRLRSAFRPGGLSTLGLLGLQPLQLFGGPPLRLLAKLLCPSLGQGAAASIAGLIWPPLH